jgi:hypothetical protein
MAPVFRDDPGLVSLWLLEEASGARADAVGSNDLTDNNTVGQSTADPKEGDACADFEAGNSEYLSITDAAQAGLGVTGNLTICGWAKPETNGVNGALAAKYTAGGDQRSYALYLSSTGSARAILSGDGSATVTAESPGSQWSAGTWIHVAVVYDGTDIRVYLDGALASNGASNPATYSGGIYNSSAAFNIGAWNAGASLWFDGLLDEMAVFDRALSADEVAGIAAYGIQTRPVTTGELTLSGSLSLRVQHAVAGDLTSSGVLASVPVYTQAAAGALTWSGSLGRQISLSLAGALASAGALGRQLALGLVGALGSSGALAIAIAKNLAGALTPTGSVSTSVSMDLTTLQKTLTGTPAVTLTIGSHDLSEYVIAYKYEEAAEEPGSLAIWLDNRDDNFDDLASDWPQLVRGAAVDLRRGLSINGVASTEKLPRCWIDSMQFLQDDGAGMLLLDCIDWWGKLEKFRYGALQTWTSTNVKTIAAAILGQVGLTLATGTFGFDTAFEVDVNTDGDRALQDLMDRVDEFLYAGLDGEIQFKVLDPAEVASYSYDWSDGGGSGHPLLPETEIAESSADYNKIVVIGGANGQYSGTAEDTAESALVGVRQRTITDTTLASNAQCLEHAQGELSYWQARSTAGTLVARPHFTLRLYDVVSVAAPPWGGPAVSKARVTEIVERYGLGDWEQEITIGDLPERALLHVENRPGRRKSTASRKKAKRTSRTSKTRRTRTSWARKDHTHDQQDIDTGFGLIPSGCILMWSGAVEDIPAGWALCDGTNGTPDLRDKFIAGAGGTLAVGDTGGQDTADLSHAHGPGTLHTNSDNHNHTPGTLTPTEANNLANLVDTNHDGSTTNFASNGHTHTLTGNTGSDSHSHSVTTGATAPGGQAAHDNRPVFYTLAFVMYIGAGS